MKVREWIEALSEMDPEYEVGAMNLLGEWVRVVPVKGAAVRPQMNRKRDGSPRREFVKIVREGDEDPQPWARW